MVATLIVNQGKVVRPSQLIARVIRTEGCNGTMRRVVGCALLALVSAACGEWTAWYRRPDGKLFLSLHKQERWPMPGHNYWFTLDDRLGEAGRHARVRVPSLDGRSWRFSVYRSSESKLLVVGGDETLVVDTTAFTLVWAPNEGAGVRGEYLGCFEEGSRVSDKLPRDMLGFFDPQLCPEDRFHGDGAGQ